jgi:predicted permease
VIGALAGALPALQGFFTIGVLIGVGWLLARVGELTLAHRKLKSLLALYVASPALMFTTMSQADLTRVFAASVIASYGAIGCVAGLYIIATILVFHHNLAGRTIGTLLSCYSNAGNLGIPVAAYALGDVTWVVPILLIQMVVLQPGALAILDACQARQSGSRLTVGSLVSLPFRNPLTVGVLLGLAANLAQLHWGFALPGFVVHPVEMLGNVAVPTMLLAFGISLCLDPKPARGADRAESWFLVGLKVIWQPLAAYLLAAAVLHLDPATVKAVTVVAALPCAQNIFIFASKYEVRMVFARDTIFRATAVSVVAILAAAVLA